VKVLIEYWASPEIIEEGIMNGGSISDIYPNPAISFVNIDYQLTPQVKTAQIRIVNLLGTLVTEAEIERNVNKLTIDVSQLKNGIYFYTLLINGAVYQTQKLIVQ